MKQAIGTHDKMRKTLLKRLVMKPTDTNLMTIKQAGFSKNE